MRTLLLAEDTGFYGHRGIDLRGSARGASTITQQLAKNLFLSRDKQLGRKLQELATRSCSSRADQYQSSFAHGTPGPGLRSLIDEPLAKLRSLSAAARPDDRWRIETAGKGSTKSPSSSVLRLYRTPVGVISGLILFRLVAFWGRSTMGWSVPFSLGEFFG